VLGRETVDPISRRYVPKSDTPEGEGVDQCLAQDYILLRSETCQIPYTAMWSWQIKVLRRAFSQVVRDLAAIHLNHAGLVVDDGDHE
jgi:hypothetical protein